MTLVENFRTDILEIHRYSKGTIKYGKYESQEITPFNVNAVVQPMKSKELVDFPDLQHIKGKLIVYTDIELNTANEEENIKADYFIWRNDKYSVYVIDDRTQTDLPHFKSVAIKTDAFEDKRQ